MVKQVEKLGKECGSERIRILDYWSSTAVDNENGGFVGAIGHDGTVDKEAIKGAVLTSRILWTFSAASHFSSNALYLEMADRAYGYIRDHFIDTKNGGIYWSVDARGVPYDKRKQIYAIAFGIYALSEYAKVQSSAEVMELCASLFEWIEKVSFDKKRNGYFEAFGETGKLLDDLRLSEKDRNDPKTMNTHLHLLEAYTNLYTIRKDAIVKESLMNMIDLFLTKFINPVSSHLYLFFTEDWKPTKNAVSFGHDIEASWLLLEAAKVLNDTSVTATVREYCLKLVAAASEGLQTDGSLVHEYDYETKEYLLYREWWVSAEALVGFMNAYQLNGQTAFLEKTIDAWNFIKKYLIDRINGEWIWGVDGQLRTIEKEKVSMWKCPYHTTRACMEIERRCAEIVSMESK